MSRQSSKPNLSEGQVFEVVKRLYALEVSTIRPLPSYDDQNFYVATTKGGGEYVLKVMNSVDSQNPDLIDVQTHAMSFLQEHGFPTQTVVPKAAGQFIHLQEIDHNYERHLKSILNFIVREYSSIVKYSIKDCGYGCQKYMVRLMTYLPGTTIAKVPTTPQLLYQVGKMVARIDTVLHEMDHPHLSALQRDSFIWSLSNVPLLEGYIHILDGDPLQEVVKSILNEFQTSVLPNLPEFRISINHGDLNDQNILVEPDNAGGGDYRISGILDFSDMSAGYYVHELAITIMYMMIENPNPVEVGRPIIEGWESVFPLNREEKDCLYLLVLCRFCQSLVMARHTVKLHPENEEYLMITSKTGIHILRQLWELGKAEVEKVWFEDGSWEAESVGCLKKGRGRH